LKNAAARENSASEKMYQIEQIAQIGTLKSLSKPEHRAAAAKGCYNSN
jgi:hypothetical protein